MEEQNRVWKEADTTVKKQQKVLPIMLRLAAEAPIVVVVALLAVGLLGQVAGAMSFSWDSNDGWSL